MIIDINNCKLINLPTINDQRGSLTSIEEVDDIPISINRIFYMHSISSNRGGHAHIDTDQIIIPISGNFFVKVSDKLKSKDFELNQPNIGLYVPRLIYIDLKNFTSDAVCLVLANTKYDINKSLRSWDSYINFIYNAENI